MPTWLWYGNSLLCLLSCMGLALVSGLYAMPVQDVGGTLLGGIGRALPLLSLLVALTGIGLAWLIGMSGARWILAITALLLGGLAAYQWLGYPNDHDGNLIYSPTREELSGYVLLCTTALLCTLLLPQRHRSKPGWLRWTLGAALTFVSLCSLLPMLYQIQQSNLPNCAFDADSGQQLSICLGDEPRVLID